MPHRRIVDAPTLQGWLGAADLVVLDASVPYGADGPEARLGDARWLEARIPGARRADLQGALSDPTARHPFTAPLLDRLLTALQALGVADGRRVVIYDDYLNMWATRLWWLLRSVGFDSAFVLDGGIDAWRAAGLPLETGPDRRPLPAPGPLTPRPRDAFAPIAALLQNSDGIPPLG